MTGCETRSRCGSRCCHGSGRCAVRAAGGPAGAGGGVLSAARDPAGWHLVIKPGHQRDRQAVREPARQASRTLRQTAAPSGSIRRIFARLSTAPGTDTDRDHCRACGRPGRIFMHRRAGRDRPHLPHRARAWSAEILPPRPRCSSAASTGTSPSTTSRPVAPGRSRRKGSRSVTAAVVRDSGVVAAGQADGRI